MVASTTVAKDIERLLVSLRMDFDTASRAFELQTHPGWDEAAAALRETLAKVRDIGDVSALPCPVSIRNIVHGAVRVWVDAKPDVRRGLTPLATTALDTLTAYITGAIAVPEAAHGVGVR